MTAHDDDGRVAGTAKLSFYSNGIADLWSFRVEPWACGSGSDLLEAVLVECRNETRNVLRCEQHAYFVHGKQDAYPHSLVDERRVEIRLASHRCSVRSLNPDPAQQS